MIWNFCIGCGIFGVVALSSHGEERAPWLENLLILDPLRKRGANILRLRVTLGPIGGIFVQAELDVICSTRVEVCFRRGGWVGPRLNVIGQIKLLRDVRQSFPAWLDMTVLDAQLRICRGNAGTTFALLKQSARSVEEFLG